MKQCQTVSRKQTSICQVGQTKQFCHIGIPATMQTCGGCHVCCQDCPACQARSDNGGASGGVGSRGSRRPPAVPLRSTAWMASACARSSCPGGPEMVSLRPPHCLRSRTQTLQPVSRKISARSSAETVPPPPSRGRGNGPKWPWSGAVAICAGEPRASALGAREPRGRASRCAPARARASLASQKPQAHVCEGCQHHRRLSVSCLIFHLPAPLGDGLAANLRVVCSRASLGRPPRAVFPGEPRACGLRALPPARSAGGPCYYDYEYY